MQRAVLYALFLLTTACLMAVVVIERTTPAALVGFSPQNDVDEAGQLDQVYQDALKQARADDSVVGAGFQLANLEPDPFAAKHAAEAVRRAKQTRSQQAAAPPTPQPVAVAKNAQSPSTSAQLSAPAPVPALAHVRVPVAAKVPVIKSDADALAAEQRATTFIDAAKDLERAAARYEIMAKVKKGSSSASTQLSGQSILSAFGDELKKLGHLNSESSAKRAETGAWDTTDVAAMSEEVKKLDELVGALKGGKTPKDIAASADGGKTAKATAGGVQHADDGTAFEEQKQAKLSDSQSRKDLDSFFDELSRPEDVGAHAHDVGDKYDKLSSPKSIQLKQEGKEIKQLKDLVMNLAENQYAAAAAVQRGRAEMGVPAASAANAAAYNRILRAAEHSEVQALHGKQVGGLPGVNVGDWYNDRAEKASENEMLVGNRFADTAAAAGDAYTDVPSVPGYMSTSGDEGGAQLASFTLAPPPKAKKCPPCGFLPSCKVNPAALGFSRATGAFGNYPSAQRTGAQDAYGGGVEDPMTHPAHTATLRQLDSGGMLQSQAPLWTELSGLLSASNKPHARAHVRRLLEDGRADGYVEPAEGGQMLASFTLAPPPKAAPKPPPKCVCPHCKLGDEQVGWEDEHHGMLAMPTSTKVDMIDQELMKLDPSYAIKRTDPNYNTYEYPFVNNHKGIFAKGVANPLSDFHEDVQPYYNQVETKDKKTIW